MTAKHLIIGLDGADLGLVQAMGQSQLPNLFSLMRHGAFAALESVQPAATLPNWISFLTGVNPGQHGVFDFTVREGYRVRFRAGSVRQSPTFISELDRRGLTCACVGFPGTWPPEKLNRGVMISGWDSPVAFEADRSFVWPTSLFDEITARFGAYRFDDVDEFAAGEPGWHAALGDRLVARIGRKTELLNWLIDRQNWDVFACYFGEADTASHHLWNFHDPSSPRRPSQVNHDETSGLARTYSALDQALGHLIHTAGGASVEVTVLSDHGFGGASDKVLHLNLLLEELGWLSFKPKKLTSSLTQLAKDQLVPRLPSALRQSLFRSAGAILPGWVESQTRFANLDWEHTTAFSDELNYFPAIYFNIKGREPQGRLAPEALGSVIRKLQDDLLAVRDPWTGAPVFLNIWPRDSLYSGPSTERAPDILLELNSENGFSYNLLPSSLAPKHKRVPWHKLKPTEYSGRKGRSLAGSHRSRGLFVAAGPEVQAVGKISARMLDATATCLARIQGISAMPGEGEILPILKRHMFRKKLSGTSPTIIPTGMSPHQEAEVESRLRHLGYVD